MTNQDRELDTYRISRFDAALGGEVVGLDLARPLDDMDFAAVHRAFLDHQVLVFRRQRLTPEQHIAFSRRFGPLQVHVLHQFHFPGHPEILVVSNVIENGRPIGLGDAGRFWHSDLSYKPEPSLGSLLHAQEVPQAGGDTLFADMYGAYETLPLSIKRRLEGRRATHSYLYKYDADRENRAWRPKLSDDQMQQLEEVVHPVVRIHPETGRKSLFISEAFTSRILDMPKEESDELLALLFAHSSRPERVYRHKWQDGDLVFWDNRCTVHLAPGCAPEHRRTMYRTTVQGDVPA